MRKGVAASFRLRKNLSRSVSCPDRIALISLQTKYGVAG